MDEDETIHFANHGGNFCSCGLVQHGDETVWTEDVNKVNCENCLRCIWGEGTTLEQKIAAIKRNPTVMDSKHTIEVGDVVCFQLTLMEIDVKVISFPNEDNAFHWICIKGKALMYIKNYQYISLLKKGKNNGTT